MGVRWQKSPANYIQQHISESQRSLQARCCHMTVENSLARTCSVFPHRGLQEVGGRAELLIFIDAQVSVVGGGAQKSTGHSLCVVL